MIDIARLAHVEAWARCSRIAAIRLLLGLDAGTIGRANLEQAARVMGWGDVPEIRWSPRWHADETTARSRLAAVVEAGERERDPQGVLVS